MLDTSRRRALSALNSRYIYGRVPLLHTIVFIIEMAITMRLIAKFNSYYANKPVLTTMITNAILGGIADTVAQSLTAIKTRRRTLPTSTNPHSLPGSNNGPLISIELTDLKEKPVSSSLNSLIPTHSNSPAPFDFERLTRFVAYGFLMAPIQFQWYGFLSRTFPITKTRGTSSMIPALQRVAMDQLIFAPVGLALFFTYMTVAEGGGKRAITKKFQDVYLPALRANYTVWPAVQILNFRVIPIQFQIPFVNTIGIAWTAYLSLTNSADEE